MKKYIHASGNQQRAGVAILLPNKIAFNSKAERRDRGGHYIITKGSIHQEDTTIVNIYAPNSEIIKYIKQILTDLKEETDNTIIAEDFNTTLSTMDRSSRQKITKEMLNLNHTSHQMQLTDV